MADARVQRRLAAILAADVVGYSRLMGDDETGTLAALKTVRAEVVDPTVAEHGGRIVKLMGDGALVEFASVIDAVECAIAVQHRLARQDTDVPQERRITLRIGVNLGDIIIDGDDIYGDGVNVAARLEALAEPGGICVSEIVYQSVDGKLDATFTDMGPQEFKNIARPIRTWQIGPPGPRGDLPTQLTLSDKPSIAVLPFENLSGDPDQEYFAAGLTEDLINALSYWHTFYVISRHSTFQYRQRAPDTRQIARDLNVQYVLMGSVRSAGGRVRITAQLGDAETGRHVWSERYDRALEDFFDLQDEITGQIAAKVEPAFARAEQQKAIRKPPTSLAAWEWYQRGIAILDGFFKAGEFRGQASNTEAQKCFRRAIELDPADSRPVAYLAYAHFRSVMEGYSSEPEADIASTIKFAKQAIALDDGNPYAHFAYSIGLTYSGQPELGVMAAHRAVEINPNYSHAYIPLGNGLNLAGKPAEAIGQLEKAIQLNPTDPRNHAYFTFLAEAHLNNRDYEQAITWAQRAVDRDADYPLAYFVLSSALGHAGETRRSAEALAECLRLRPDCIENHPQLPLFSRAEDREHILDGLRKAGWSEAGEVGVPSLPDKPSIAVLPFDNMSDDPEQEYFADGIAEDVITCLSKFHWFFVIARNSSFSYKGSSPDVRRVAKELGVQYVLEGSVRKAGSRVRITAQLVDALTGRHVWAERYDRDLDDIFAVQDEITGAITGAVAPEFAVAEARRAGRKAPDNLDAWDCAMRGNWHLWQLGETHLGEARRQFETAVKMDSESAFALSGLAMACSWQVVWGWSDRPAETREIARKAAINAVTADDNDGWAHAALGLVFSHMRQNEEAIRACNRALELNPNLAFAEGIIGISNAWLGHYDEALLHADRASRLSPRDPAQAWWNLARPTAAFVAARYEDVVEWARKMTDATPDHPAGWRWLAVGCAYVDRLDEARAAVRQLQALVPNLSVNVVREAAPGVQPKDLERLLDGLRKAGLPEY